MGQYDYTVVHVAGDRNCSGDSLPRLVTVLSVRVRAAAVYAVSEPDESLPSKQIIWEVQQASQAKLGTLAAGATSLMTDDEPSWITNGSFCFRPEGGSALISWKREEKLQVQLLVCAHTKKPIV